MLQTITVVKVREDAMGDIIAAAEDLAKSVRAEEGCVSYQLLKTLGADDTVIFLEAWESLEAFGAHVALGEVEGAPLQRFGEVIGPASLGEPLHWDAEVAV
ncbi:MAG: antibiotic biosynthesis monooxygenase [Coriobacteriales bacterium]|jgi:quinol monooxygenase YgiN|nr:antibiotic biosynthesis monooxygenase [Coriobacteriales bacterium]